jgi:hypothetical protein
MRQVSRSSRVHRRPMLVLNLGGYIEYKYGDCTRMTMATQLVLRALLAAPRRC